MRHELDFNSPSLVFIRHGDTNYKGEGFDLTTRGIMQVRECARRLEPIVHNYGKYRVYSSPAARAQSTAEVFLRETGIKDLVDIQICHELAPLKIKDSQVSISPLTMPVSTPVPNPEQANW